MVAGDYVGSQRCATAINASGTPLLINNIISSSFFFFLEFRFQRTNIQPIQSNDCHGIRSLIIFIINFFVHKLDKFFTANSIQIVFGSNSRLYWHCIQGPPPTPFISFSAFTPNPLLHRSLVEKWSRLLDHTTSKLSKVIFIVFTNSIMIVVNVHSCHGPQYWWNSLYWLYNSKTQQPRRMDILLFSTTLIHSITLNIIISIYITYSIGCCLVYTQK